MFLIFNGFGFQTTVNVFSFNILILKEKALDFKVQPKIFYVHFSSHS